MKTRSFYNALFICCILLAKGATGQFTVEDKYTIFLESRQFTPQRETAEELIAKLESLKNKHCFIQLDDIPSEREKERLKAAGVNLLSYIPHYAWYAKIHEASLPGILNVRYISHVEVNDKISPHILEGGIVPKGRIDAEHAKINVVFFNDVGDEEIDSLISEYGEGDKLFRNSWEVTLLESRLFEFAGEDLIQWINNVPPDKGESLDVVRSRIHANEVQAPPYNLGGNGYVAAMWDSGTLFDHTDFATRILAEPDGAPYTLHATKTAGVMAGDGTRSQACGGTPFQWRGIATQASIVSYDWSDEVNEHGSAINVYGADVSQNSWTWNLCDTSWCDWFGDYKGDGPIYDSIVRGLYGDDITIVASAGNFGLCTACQSYLPNFPYGTVAGPIATSKNAISVSATRADNDQFWPTSSSGPTSDGRIKPDLSAPGCKSYGGIASTATNDCYFNDVCGTSLSAPAVSGSVLLIYEDYNNFYFQDPLPSTVRGILYHTAEDLGNVGPDYQFGYGRIDIQRAIDLIRADGGQNLRIVEDQIYHSEVHDYFMGVPTGEPELRITIVWDDKEATSGPGIKLVNNLDLVLIGPSQTTYYPWILHWNNPSNPAATGVDNRNNMEQVLINNPESGVWIARVTGSVIPYAPQLYSFIGDFMLIPGSISGIVTDAHTSNPIEGAYVEAVGTGVGDSTNNNGEYLLEALIADTYDIDFSCHGYADTSKSGILVNWDENTILDVEMRPLPGSISGTVTNTYTNQPAEGVYVEAAGTSISDTTDDNGEYLLAGLIADTYDINFLCDGYADTMITGVPVNRDETTILNVGMRPTGCDYTVGDVNGSDSYNGLDITYGVNFFKGSADPMCPFGSCSIPLCDIFFYCGDVNGSCSYNGLDITYGVNYFKGGDVPIPCSYCPPAGALSETSLKNQTKEKSSDNKLTKDLKEGFKK